MMKNLNQEKQNQDEMSKFIEKFIMSLSLGRLKHHVFLRSTVLQLDT